MRVTRLSMRDVFRGRRDHVAPFERARDEGARGGLGDVRRRRRARALEHRLEARCRRADDPRGVLYAGERAAHAREANGPGRTTAATLLQRDLLLSAMNGRFAVVVARTAAVAMPLHCATPTRRRIVCRREYSLADARLTRLRMVLLISYKSLNYVLRSRDDFLHNGRLRFIQGHRQAIVLPYLKAVFFSRFSD